MGKFKVGDKVRSMDRGYSICGHVGTVVNPCSSGYDVDFGTESGTLFHHEHELEYESSSPSSPEITLRDQFAMAALTGITSNLLQRNEYVINEMAECAYRLADAALAERERTK